MLRFLIASLFVLSLLALPRAAAAQVLIWSIPEKDTTFIKFQGKYKNTQERPFDKRGALTLEWDTELVIKSVGEEMADFNGNPTKCRWIEFVSTIKPQGRKPGPGGTRIYKVLVPVERITGQLLDSDGQPNDFVPIVRGYRKLGDGAVTEVKEKALAVNPLIVPVVYYPDLKAQSTEPVPLSLQPLGDVQAVEQQGQSQFTSDTIRTTNKGKLWLCKELPFGLAQFEVTITQEQKDNQAAADQFKQSALIEVTMKAVEQGTDAPSDLPDSK